MAHVVRSYSSKSNQYGTVRKYIQIVSQINMVQSVSIYIYIYILESSGRPSGGLDSPWDQNALLGVSECPIWTSAFWDVFNNIHD